MKEERPAETISVSGIWKRLCRNYASWKFLPLHPRDLWIATTRMGNDFISNSRKLTHWRRAEHIIADVSDHDLQRLKVWAEINRRQSENFFRVILIIYISIPITAALVLGQLYPAEWAEIDISLNEVALIFSIYSVILLILFVGHWKAREMDDFLQLSLAERGIFSGTGNDGGTEVRLPGA